MTSARNDLIFQFDLSGKLLHSIDVRSFRSELGSLNWRPTLQFKDGQIQKGRVDYRHPRSHDPHFSDAAHVNSIQVFPDGRLLISLGLLLNPKFKTLLLVKKLLVRLGLWQGLLAANREIGKKIGKQKSMHSDLVIQPASGKSVVILMDPHGNASLKLSFNKVTVPSHSLRLLRDGSAIYLNTTSGEVLHFDPLTGENYGSTSVTEGFLRGAVELPDGTVLLGSKGEVIHFDLSRKAILSSFVFSHNPNESVYDIAILPDHFRLPPESFARLHDTDALRGQIAA